MRYTPHNVVQTPWASRTAFQDGSVDVAHDGVRDYEEEEEEKDEEEDEGGGGGEEEGSRSVWKAKERESARARE